VSTPDGTRPRVGIRRRFVVLAAALGVAIVAVAWRLSDWEDPAAFWSGVLVNVGTTILLAGFIFALERSFVRTTRTAVREAATEAATIAATEVERKTVDLTARLDSIQDQIDRRRAEHAQQEDEVLANLEGSTSWRAMWDAMEAATNTGSIEASVTVLGGLTPSSPLVEIALRRAWEGWGAEDGVPDALVLSLQPPPTPEGNVDVGGDINSVWTEEMAPADAFIALEEEMVRRRYGDLSRALDAAAFVNNLRVGLADAMDGRRGLDGAWRSTGDLWQILGPDWCVTDLGIEEREHGVVLPKEAFPAFKDDWDPGVEFKPPCPGWVDPAWWDFVVLRAQANSWRWVQRHF
jgi:hypothetical protein